MLARVANAPEWELTDQEGENFIYSCQQVMRHYAVETTQATMDWVALFGSIVAIYGTRVVLTKQRLAEQHDAQAGNVHPLFTNVAPSFPGG